MSSAATTPAFGLGTNTSTGFGGFGTTPTNTAFGAQPSTSAFGAAPATGFGTTPATGFGAAPATGFGAAPASTGFGKFGVSDDHITFIRLDLFLGD